MDPLWFVAAFAFGAVSTRLGLPPLVGYLMAGFVLNGLGITGGSILGSVADAGVTLLLFTIGLKLKLKTLARPEVWGGTTAHMLISGLFFFVLLTAVGTLGATLFQFTQWQTAAMIAFALSFSSTVFAVKVFEAKKELSSRHADTAIGILIMQDIIAVLFLTASASTLPSPASVALVPALFVARQLLRRLMAQCGHGELLMLFGILMTVGGYSSFELVGLKGDLGALVFGWLLADHPKASELADRLLGFKDLFLVGFFLNIGITGTLTTAGLVAALGLAVVMPFKSILFFLLLTRFRLRARTAMLAAMGLSSYSEFGLIVGAIGVSAGWMSAEWLVVIAIALSATFVLAAPMNVRAHTLYAKHSGQLKHFETAERLPGDKPVETGGSTVAIIGMGGVGSSAYDEMTQRYGSTVIGVDFCADTVADHRAKGRHAVYGDAEDSDFWQRFNPSNSRINLVMLALPDPKSSVFAIRQMQESGYRGRIAVSVRYEDQIDTVKAEGVEAVYSLYEEAGVGFSDHVCNHMAYCESDGGPDLPLAAPRS
jgi:glutathione-regulated potassium-efflux system ancillary protein KefC